jgi:glutamate-5-semialdehyde dehydrogenase
MTRLAPLQKLEAGMPILVGGDQVAFVDEELAARFAPGDALAVAKGTLLHIPAAERQVARDAVTRTVSAFERMATVSTEQISDFFRRFAELLADDAVWNRVLEVNRKDVATAQSRGRSTTRLEATEKMRQGMIDGLRGWVDATSQRGRIIESVDHGSWRAELVGAELGVVAFVFEGRPNVVADATGVLRGGNTVVFRIGRDALATAKAILELATVPALEAAGLPKDAVTVVDSASHAAGWALFSDSRLALAVARGSGSAVDTLGSLAQSAGIPVSLHGTGGAWLVVTPSATPEQLSQNVFDSLDRKVCNTLNTCCIVRSEAARLVPAFVDGLRRAGERRNTTFKLHVSDDAQSFVPAELFSKQITVDRADGARVEPQAEPIEESHLGEEWEWENTPEVTLTIVDDVPHAMRLFNRYSPRFVACLLSTDAAEHDRFYGGTNAPFVGDGFTRWVDGQYALKRPELGLSNWEHGRLFGRGGVLAGDSVFTVRTRVRGTSAGKPA